MRILILHNEIPPDASADAHDVLVQVAAVQAALHALEHEVAIAACTLDLATVQRIVGDYRPELVFNLVESVGGADRLMSLVPQLLDVLQVPYTGTSATGILRTSNKVWAKREMRRAGIATPKFFCPSDHFDAPPDDDLFVGEQQESPRQFIVKAIAEHASVGMDERAIVCVSSLEELTAACADWQQRNRFPCFAEQFIAGREFNLSLLAASHGVQVLPPAEINFAAFPPGVPRVVDYRAKWDDSSFEYQHTPRCFHFPAQDRPLLNQLENVGVHCWQAFGLRGYARVDFRVDEFGQPWVLEINANPCLSPDAGFAAALAEAKIGYQHAIERILFASRGSPC